MLQIYLPAMNVRVHFWLTVRFGPGVQIVELTEDGSPLLKACAELGETPLPKIDGALLKAIAKLAPPTVSLTARVAQKFRVVTLTFG